MPNNFSIDIETRSKSDLKTEGVWKYAKDPSTSVICLAYLCHETGEQGVWKEGETLPKFMTDKDVILHAFNAEFEYAVLKHTICPFLTIDRFLCTMAHGAYLHYGGSLFSVSQRLALVEEKDKKGANLIKKLSFPQKDGSFLYDKELLNQMYDYCQQDVVVEKCIHDTYASWGVAYKWTQKEIALWRSTIAINEKGVKVDMDLLNSLYERTETFYQNATKEFKELTGGLAPTQRVKIIAWANSLGDHITSTAASYLATYKAKNEKVAKAIEILSLNGMSAPRKVYTLKNMCVNGRYHGLLKYYAASTGRWGGQGFQIQNIFRPNNKEDEGNKIASSLRSLLIPDEGYTFTVADYSSIENRVLAWLCGQEDALDSFRQGLDQYKLFASSAWNIPYDEVTKDKRQIAKSAVLGCGFAMSPPALQAYGKNFGLELTEKDASFLVNAWREANSAIVQGWDSLHDRAMEAYNTPGKTFNTCNVTFKYDKMIDILLVKLPSGRVLFYPQPDTEKNDWGRKVLTYNDTGMQGVFRKKLTRGTIAENVTQATARDFLATHLIEFYRKAPERLMFHVHDELVVLGDLDIDMAHPPAWASDFPLAYESEEGLQHYTK